MHAPFGADVAADDVEKVADLEQRFTALVHRHRDRAWRLAWRLLKGDEAAADDVTQDALVRAYRGLSDFRDESKLETWFFRIVVRQAHTYRRWRAVRDLWHGSHETDAPDPRQAAPGDPMLRRRIARALETLTTSQRDAFVLVHLEGFSVRETAGIMQKAEGTVKSHLQRALQSLRRELKDVAPRREIET
jgi:RNA polymerase sigma-70 factor (ECF subfamily)